MDDAFSQREIVFAFVGSPRSITESGPQCTLRVLA